MEKEDMLKLGPRWREFCAGRPALATTVRPALYAAKESIDYAILSGDLSVLEHSPPFYKVREYIEPYKEELGVTDTTPKGYMQWILAIHFCEMVANERR